MHDNNQRPRRRHDGEAKCSPSSVVISPVGAARVTTELDHLDVACACWVVTSLFGTGTLLPCPRCWRLFRAARVDYKTVSTPLWGSVQPPGPRAAT
ncbi:hypothetical protein J7E96_23920 [Streptomyces sp. ISL-96]|uniref:hypothetical protein n=1 Tax=Streptomyces sp. ISL-96 TaxID=2819191 RepID=UPI001BE51604|nr:hypothetical protein [Streptomyces sp. ISL-96]MBT2491517.1 hypothetical protein [Streptomyces sp. ISL-96]